MQDQERPKRPYHFHMPMEEIHEIRSRAGKIGGKGRPKGSVNSGYNLNISKDQLSQIHRANATGPHHFTRPPKPHCDAAAPGEQRFAMNMPRSSYEIFSKCAIYSGETRIQFLHNLALSLKSDPRYAHLFATPTSQPQTM